MMTIRPIEARDLDALGPVVDATLFPADMLAPMVAPALAGDTSDIWLTALQDDRPVGLCFAAPEEMAQGTWNMRALAVAQDIHRQGYGTALVQAMEETLKSQGARIMIVDTSSEYGFADARAFYGALGYHDIARVPDFWSKGDDKVIFWKDLSAQ